MKVYQLVHKDYNGELVFGLPFPYQSEGEKKVNNLFSKMRPWKHCIPYYNNSKFAFVSLDALITFLYGNNLTEHEIADIENYFYVKEFDLTTWSSGLSNFLCTYFEDEINEEVEIRNLELKDIKNLTVKFIKQDPVPDEDIKLTKESYYSNVKIYY